MGNLVKICLAVSLIWVLSFAQEPNVVWTETYGGAMRDKGYSVQQTRDGGFIVAGETCSFSAGQTDVYLVKTDPLGNEQWHKHFGTPNYDGGYSVQQTSDDGYIITGIYDYADIYLIKTYPSGEIQWWKSIGTSYLDRGNCVQQTIDGGYIIVGITYGYNNPGDVYLVKTNSQGDVQWTRHYGTNWCDCGNYVQQTSDGGYIITGTVLNQNNNNSDDVWLIKTDAYGHMQWEKRFGGTVNDVGYCVQQTIPDGGYIINAFLHHTEGDFMWLIKTDDVGNLQWDKKLRPTPTSIAKGYSVKQTEDLGYVAVGDADLDVYVVKTDRDGNIEWQKTIDGSDHGRSVDLVRDGSYIIAGSTTPIPHAPPWSEVYLIKLGNQINDTDDPLALAYNGNRHLVRKPNSEELHLVYTSEDKVIYVTSTNGGTDWSEPEIIGEGKYPAIALDADHLPSVTWTDDNGGLWYGKQNASSEWDVYHLYNPGVWDPCLNSPPSIAIIPSVRPGIVHILVTRTGGIPGNGVEHKVEDYSFPITQPGQGAFELIEQCMGPPDPPLRSFPSITKCDVDNSLHGVWQRVDTICYATRTVGDEWNNWGPRFEYDGLQSAHPFVETYGDSVFVVWQRDADEEVYRAARHLSYTFGWQNFSLTPATKSLYPVNASGFFTVFNDEIEPPVDSRYEVFYKIEPDDPLTNISQTIYKSIYPQSVARFHVGRKYVYTAWLEGDEAPYGIHFKKIRYIEPDKPDRAFLSSSNGHNPSSPYLIARDSIISDWQIPVDIGYETITYQFPLVPGYRYKLKTVAYHEREDKWKTKVMIDNEEVAEIEYEAYEPETLECWIPPAFYADSVIEVMFECDDGDFAAVGPIFIYQYEYEEGEGGFPGGPMVQQGYTVNNRPVAIYPNPFKEKLTITYQSFDKGRVSINIYDVTGRLVKQFDRTLVSLSDQITWNGNDQNGRIVAQGIYFIRIENLDSGETLCRKVLKIK